MLDLANNKLTSIRFVNEPRFKKLAEFYVQGNLVEAIPQMELQNLKIFNITKNKLTKFDSKRVPVSGTLPE